MAEYIEREALLKDIEERSETAQIQVATRRTGKTLWLRSEDGWKKERQQMKLKATLDTNAYMPTRAHEADAGMDLYSPVAGAVYPGDSMTIDTGVHIEIPVGYVGMVKSKSGLNVNYGITSEGVIDAGYTGSIVVKLYNHGNCAVPIEVGQKISQLVILPIITPELELVESLEDTERGANGFGSSGKF